MSDIATKILENTLASKNKVCIKKTMLTLLKSA